MSEINRYTRDWIAYFRLATTPSIYQELLRLGVPKERAALGAGGASPWRMSHSLIRHETLNNAYWRSTGLESITEQYNQLRYSH